MLDIERLFIFSRNKGKKQYLHLVHYSELESGHHEEEWEGKIRKLKLKVNITNTLQKVNGLEQISQHKFKQLEKMQS